MFERFINLVNQDNFNEIKNKKILIIGLGGVGGYVVESLVRSGISNIILADYDVVDITNKNRQIIALDSTIGMKKTECFKNRILDINKDINIEIVDKFIDSTSDIFDKYNLDYVVDACDSIETKKFIIKTCIDKKIKCISSMGTAKKLDPTRLKITTLDKTTYDPLAKKLRKEFKNTKKIMVVSSDEKPIDSDSRTLSSCSFVPPVAGLLITSYIINDIIKK